MGDHFTGRFAGSDLVKGGMSHYVRPYSRKLAANFFGAYVTYAIASDEVIIVVQFQEPSENVYFNLLESG